MKQYQNSLNKYISHYPNLYSIVNLLLFISSISQNNNNTAGMIFVTASDNKGYGDQISKNNKLNDFHDRLTSSPSFAFTHKNEHNSSTPSLSPSNGTVPTVPNATSTPTSHPSNHTIPTLTYMPSLSPSLSKNSTLSKVPSFSPSFTIHKIPTTSPTTSDDKNKHNKKSFIVKVLKLIAWILFIIFSSLVFGMIMSNRYSIYNCLWCILIGICFICDIVRMKVRTWYRACSDWCLVRVFRTRGINHDNDGNELLESLLNNSNEHDDNDG